MRLKDLGELGFIDLLKQNLIIDNDKVIMGIGDDTAVLAPSGNKQLLFTTDMLVEGVHFSLAYGSYRQIGHKALAVNISDIAAMGGQPTHAVVSLAIPSSTKPEELQQLYQGMAQLAKVHGVNIVGGDTVKSPAQFVINVALLGEVERGKAIFRSGARPGDLVMVTGTLGDSAAGLQVCQRPELTKALNPWSILTKRHLEPQPQLKAGGLLAHTGLVTSMNDISDGLSREVREICAASNVGCLIDTERIPLSGETLALAEATGSDPYQWALYGGEDFQLVFTIKPEGLAEINEIVETNGFKVALVGEITAGDQGIRLKTAHGLVELTEGGYDHFSD